MHLNTQRPEPFDNSTGDVLDFHSSWHTIQGEGRFAGYPAIFIRLAGCNIQCPGCDTEYTAKRRTLGVVDIMRGVSDLESQHPTTKLVVITGGEPMRQDITKLVKELVNRKFHVQIESNGILSPPMGVLEEIWNGTVSYCVSPKTSRVCEEARFAHWFKYVLSAHDISKADGLPIKALGHAAKPQVARPPAEFAGDIYVNPMNEYDDDKNYQNLMAARDSALRYGYIVGIQLHLLLDLP